MGTEAREHQLTVDELVDEASMDSFPASDPPSYWAREPSAKREGEETGSSGDEGGPPRRD